MLPGLPERAFRGTSVREEPGRPSGRGRAAGRSVGGPPPHRGGHRGPLAPADRTGLTRIARSGSGANTNTAHGATRCGGPGDSRPGLRSAGEVHCRPDLLPQGRRRPQTLTGEPEEGQLHRHGRDGRTRIRPPPVHGCPGLGQASRHRQPVQLPAVRDARRRLHPARPLLGSRRRDPADGRPQARSALPLPCVVRRRTSGRRRDRQDRHATGPERLRGARRTRPSPTTTSANSPSTTQTPPPS